MKRKLLTLFHLLLVTASVAMAQDKLKIKFGNVTAADFKPTAYAIDSNANAVVIADVGSTEIVGNSKSGISLLYRNYRRAHILNKNGYDLADVEIELYTNGDAEEELENLKAVTYNLENGKVVETKLEIRSSVFKDKINKNRVVKKFTFPNIREGSIIEYEYRIKSDFIRNLQPWEFQGDYPRLWSEYNVAMPEFINYVTLSQGYQPFAVKDQKSRRDNFTISENRSAGATDRSTFTAGVTDFRWVMKDVPALKEEEFTSTLRNHISKIEFQLASLRDPFLPKSFMDTWPNVSKQLMEDEDFGLQLTKDNGWLGDEVKEAARNASNATDEAKNIYAWMRDNFTCTSHGGTQLQQSLKNVLKSRNGNVAEINLLLTAMLRKAGLEADPVMLSTRSHGYVHSLYPLMDRFNYVITRVMADGKEYYLDATEPGLGFGKLRSECYNGHARVINEEATPVELSAESLKESTATAVFIINDEKGKMIGSLQQIPGYYESLRLRSRIKLEGQEKYIKSLEKSLGVEVAISNARIDSLDKYEEPVGIFYDFDIKSEQEDIIYLNPMFGEGFKENPFKSAQRFYPVEMPYTMDQVYTLQMEIPKGYVLDELPKQTVVKFNEEGDALFEYRISSSGDNIMLRSRIQIKRAYFDPEEYEILREFFNMIVKKHNEQIVFKKKK
jgi:Transglutaminase-like superfamily/Domain of Unknown Function with PDB structure (DUF3857)